MPCWCFSNFTKMLWNHVFRAYDALVALVFQLTLLLAFLVEVQIWLEAFIKVLSLALDDPFLGKRRFEIFSPRHQSDTSPKHVEDGPVQIRTFPQKRGSLFGPGVCDKPTFSKRITRPRCIWYPCPAILLTLQIIWQGQWSRRDVSINFDFLNQGQAASQRWTLLAFRQVFQLHRLQCCRILEGN